MGAASPPAGLLSGRLRCSPRVIPPGQNTNVMATISSTLAANTRISMAGYRTISSDMGKPPLPRETRHSSDCSVAGRR